MKNNNNSILALQHSGGGSRNFIFKKNEPRLQSLWIEIPDYCHLHCDYCYASTDNEPKNNKEYLSFEDFERFLREFSELGGKYVGLPGKGEPFHNKNWELTRKIVDLCAELRLELAIFTTGDLIFFDPSDRIDTEPKFDKIEAIKGKEVILLIKCNSLNYKIQNRLVNDKRNKYAQLRERAIDLLINKYHLNDQQRPRLGIVTSVLKDNENEIVELYGWAKENNVIFDCDTILERGRGKDYTESGKVPSKIDLEEVFSKLKKVGAVTNCQGGTYVGSTCDRIFHHLYVSVVGEIFPCIGCLREDIKEYFSLGNIKNTTLSKAWGSQLRQGLANNHKDIFIGTCKSCQNFIDETCYSCLGRCTKKVEKLLDSETCFIHTTGCIHHKPSTTTWLTSAIDYVRRILSYPETHKILDEEGLERLWRPNKSIAFSLQQLTNEKRQKAIKDLLRSNDPQNDNAFTLNSDVIDAHIGNFSKRKYFRFEDISFPMNKVWDFTRFPDKIIEEYKLTTEDKGKLMSVFSQSFLSNVFLPSIKILFRKYDDSGELIRYCNFMLYDNFHKKYFYRSISKDIEDENNNDRALIISRWYEDMPNGKNLWKDNCYDLSDAFSDEIYSDYELVLGGKHIHNPGSNSKHRIIDLTKIIELDGIQEKVDHFMGYVSLNNLEFRNEYTKNINQENINLKEVIINRIFTELEDDNVINKLTSFYKNINNKAFYTIKDDEVKLLLTNLEIHLNAFSARDSASKKLLGMFNKVKNSDDEIKFLNYFIYLGIVKEVLEINYYYITYSTNFTNFSINASNKNAVPNLRSIIKPNGLLLCSTQPINTDFRAELKLFISNIFAPFDEYHFKKLYGEAQAEKQFKEKSEAHRHTLLNLINGVNPYLDGLSNDYIKYGTKYICTVAQDICSKEEERDSVGRQFPENPKDILNELISFFKANEGKTMDLQNHIQDTVIRLGYTLRIDFFTIMYNLIHNASKSDSYQSFNYNYEFRLEAKQAGDYYEIIITNPAIMNDEVLEFLNNPKMNLSTYPFNKIIKPRRGMAILKRIINENSKYGWSIEAYKEEEKQETKITLKIK